MAAVAPATHATHTTHTTPEYVKKEKLLETLRKNPHKTAKLKEIIESTEIERQTETKFGFAIYPLKPRATLARILFEINPEFRAASESVRTSILREEVVELGKKVEKLNGRKHPKKKIQEALASPVPGHWDVLDQALAAIYDVQLVFMNESAKKISFAPDDIRSWDMGKRIIVLESNGAEAWEWETASPLNLGNFLSKMEEDEEWKIVWPEATGTMKDMEAELGMAAVDANGKKLKKDELASRLGKIQAKKALS